MIEKVKTYFERLECLSTEELDRSTEKLVRAEKRNLALVIAHIAEMSRRRGHVERGYKSLWDLLHEALASERRVGRPADSSGQRRATIPSDTRGAGRESVEPHRGGTPGSRPYREQTLRSYLPIVPGCPLVR